MYTSRVMKNELYKIDMLNFNVIYKSWLCEDVNCNFILANINNSNYQVEFYWGYLTIYIIENIIIIK